jgi:gliding motility-associated-like protein
LIFIQNFKWKYTRKTALVLLFVLCVSFQNFAQFSVSNACAIDYNALINEQIASGVTSPVDPRAYYVTSTTFIDTNPNSTDWEWDFGDGSPRQKGRIVQHQFPNPALFTITLYHTVAGVTQVVGQTVRIEQAPTVPVLTSKFDKRDSTSCDAFTLNPYKGKLPPSNVTYEWYPRGETTPTIIADSTDLYSVKVTDTNTGCFVSASVYVNICGEQPTRQSNALHYFGNGMVRIGNHGATSQATPYPVNSFVVENGFLVSQSPTTSIQNPNLGRFQQYLFTTDGVSIYDNKGQKMPSATGIVPNFSLIAGESSSKNSMIVPIIAGDTMATTQYYAFGISTAGNMYFTKIETAGKPLGEGLISQNAILLEQNMSGRMALSPYIQTLGHYLLVTQDRAGNFITYKISNLGLEGPINTPGNHTATNNNLGQMKFTQDGSKIVSTYLSPPENFLEICNVDSTSGNISGCVKHIINNDPNASVLGVEFSADGRYVYYTANYTSPSDGVTSRLFRFDTSTGTHVLVDKLSGKKFGSLQAVNSPGQSVEILVAVEGEKYIGSIRNTSAQFDNIHTNNADTSIVYRQDIIDYKIDRNRFPSKNANASLFNYVKLPNNSNSNADSFEFDTGCEDDQIMFQASAGCDLPPEQIKYEWDYGDGSATGVGQRTQHTYVNPGLYRVRLFLTYCPSIKPPLILEDTIQVLPKVQLNLQPKYIHCFRLTPNLSVESRVINLAQLSTQYPNQVQYSWNPLVTPYPNNPTSFNTTAEGKFEVTINNTYDVEGVDVECISKYNTEIVELCPPVFVVPTAFSPNNDNINSKLTIAQQDLASAGFEFRIYNRWGELVYFSEDLAETSWDGKFKQKDCQPDSYAWTVRYYSRFDPTGVLYQYQGALLLVR